MERRWMGVRFDTKFLVVGVLWLLLGGSLLALELSRGSSEWLTWSSIVIVAGGAGLFVQAFRQ